MRSARIIIVALLLLGLAGFGAGLAQEKKGGSAPAFPIELKPAVKGKGVENPYPPEMAKRGRELVMAGSCNDCHTPSTYDKKLGIMVPDWDRMLSGHPEGAPDPQGELGPGDIALIGPTLSSYRLPFGITYSLNLTPDFETGTGSWTEQMFIDIFRKGRHLGGNGRPVYPPMPWHYIRYLSDEDLKSIFAYLRSIPPITNLPPTEKIPPPVADAIIDMNNKIIALQKDPNVKLEDAKGPPPPPPIPLKPVQPGKGPNRTYPPELVARGKTLVMVGSCNDCHTPWTYDKVMGGPAPDMSRMLSGHPEGGPDPQGKLGEGDMWLIGPTFTSHKFPWGVAYSRNLTPDIETGIGGWTEQQFLDVFRKGKHPDGRVMLPPMPWSLLRNLSDEDLKAMFAYLQSVPPLHNKVADPKIGAAELAKFEKINAGLLERNAP